MAADRDYTEPRAMGLTDCLRCGATVAKDTHRIHDLWHENLAGEVVREITRRQARRR